MLRQQCISSYKYVLNRPRTILNIYALFLTESTSNKKKCSMWTDKGTTLKTCFWYSRCFKSTRCPIEIWNIFAAHPFWTLHSFHCPVIANEYVCLWAANSSGTCIATDNTSLQNLQDTYRNLKGRGGGNDPKWMNVPPQGSTRHHLSCHC